VQATWRPRPEVVVKPLSGAPLWCRYVLAWRSAALPGAAVETLCGAAAAAYRDLIVASPSFQAWAARTYQAR
jgi:hypothetical protein